MICATCFNWAAKPVGPPVVGNTVVKVGGGGQRADRILLSASEFDVIELAD